MNSEEAKSILSSYHRNCNDESDPEIIKALELMAATPEGEEWLNEQLRYDEIIKKAVLSDDVAKKYRQEMLDEIKLKNASDVKKTTFITKYSLFKMRIRIKKISKSILIHSHLGPTSFLR